MEIKRGNKIKWKKVGGGLHRLPDGRDVKAGDVFYADAADIPMGFRDIIIPLEEPAPTADYGENYRMVGNAAGWYDVVEFVSGRVLNEKRLRKIEAEQLLADLLGE